MDEFMYGCIDRTDGILDGCMNGWLVGWINGWMGVG
jgi:hypothetical protein